LGEKRASTLTYPRERLRGQIGEREWNWFGQRQQFAHAGNFSDGYPGFREEFVPVEYSRITHVV
jgi:hypothetical protein